VALTAARKQHQPRDPLKVCPPENLNLNIEKSASKYSRREFIGYIM
jgi:hypothetical protein